MSVVYRLFIFTACDKERRPSWCMVRWLFLLNSKIIITLTLLQGIPQLKQLQRKSQKRSISWDFRAKTIAYRNLAIDCITHKFLLHRFV